MKHFAPSLKIACMAILCGVLMVTCRKTEIDPDDGSTPNPTDSTETSSIADHLQFFNASKKQGKVPAAPAGSSSLKISIKDTLYLMDVVKTPIKFLHDAATNVAGVYVQVSGSSFGSTGGTFDYYDVPELTETAESDSISVVFVGFDPADFELPLRFVITITPYDESGKPLDEIKLPVVIKELNDDPNKPGSCGLVLPAGDFWSWDISMIVADKNDTSSDLLKFVSTPGLVFGAGGQDIQGSCCNGVSKHGICNGDSLPNASLHFSTFYEIRSETFVFSDNGTFLRQTFEKTANPFTDESDFCGSGPGVVKQKLNHTVYNGNWTLKPAPVPPDLRPALGDTNNSLTLQGTSSTGGGFGNPGGQVFSLDCSTLVLIQVDREGHGQHLIKFYTRISPGDEPWYAL